MIDKRLFNHLAHIQPVILAFIGPAKSYESLQNNSKLATIVWVHVDILNFNKAELTGQTFSGVQIDPSVLKEGNLAEVLDEVAIRIR